MNSQQIEYFLSAVRHLNFTKVADEFFTSQPTVSRQIALLEDELGFELFIRDKGILHLTVGGAIMALEFATSTQIIRDAIARVELVSNGLDGEISIGYYTGMNTDFYGYPPSMSFMSEYPLINLTMTSMSFSGLRDNLESGELDIIYTHSFELPAIPNSLHIKCHPVSAVIAMSSTHPLAGKKDLSEQDFSGQTFLLPSPEESENCNTMVRELLKQLGIMDVTFINMNNIESMLIGVRSGAGLSMVDSSIDLIYDKRYRCYKLPPEMEFNAVDMVAVWKKENVNPIIPIYLEMLKAHPGIGKPIALGRLDHE